MLPLRSALILGLKKASISASTEWFDFELDIFLYRTEPQINTVNFPKRVTFQEGIAFVDDSSPTVLPDFERQTTAQDNAAVGLIPSWRPGSVTVTSSYLLDLPHEIPVIDRPSPLLPSPTRAPLYPYVYVPIQPIQDNW
mmetsp:Transcript_4698/g.10524  ORF Transcript_4698/g.10524 Transcript_4698/m.10524 type:complete len:139 (-) Transcript_4698:82-498(-)